ncbi:citrate synthase/methylcitrate synthase [Paenibacillus thalictri]|uniref:Citrate synthase n=1 Tax=Paenibacillus thalictri TaxID=2527873 RepID=A0A4Q9DVJ0_9BACL|nr:citrate synthase/methylcitrate synthase [Paenibacillus thalictri]TBL80375.1 citrate synthase/methylcitrate synthase [Paenibacillus thalictri]
MPKVTGLEGIVAAETDISLVDGIQGHLIYRGYWAKDLAVQKSYEEVAYLLWFGRLPDAAEASGFQAKLAQLRELPAHLKLIIDSLPGTIPMMSVLQTAVAALATPDFAWPPTADQAALLTAVLPTVIAYRQAKLNGTPWVGPDAELDHTSNYLYMLIGKKPEEAHAKALGAYLVLGMEHGMNASTFAARVVASTQADLASAVCGGIGAMKGPLHGGAPSEVTAMLEEIGTKDHAETWLRHVLEQGGRLMGFGHRIYKTRDPRAEALQAVALQLNGQDHWLDLALHVEETAVRLLEEYKPGRRLYANVEFYAAAVMRAIDLPAELFTPTFTVGRIVGWTAHVLEQADVNRIFRPQSVYTGDMPAQ